MRIIFPILMLLIFCSCQTTAVRTSQQNFLTTWNNRLDQYRNEFNERYAIIQSKADDDTFNAELIASDTPWEFIVNRVLELSVMVREAYTVAGQGETIKAFIQHMETHPTPGLTDVWFTQQIEDLNRRSQVVNQQTQEFFAGFNEKIKTSADWIMEIGQLAMAQGYVIGATNELQSLHKQAISYYEDMYRAQIEDRYRAEKRARTAQALLAIGMYINQLNYQQQLLNTLNKPRTCIFIGNAMTCY